MKCTICSVACVALLMASALSTPARAQTSDADLQVQMAEARRHFDALEYENAVPVLDRVVALLQSRQADDARRQLTGMLELRARSRFALGDQDGARQDFTALLRADSSYTLNAQVSPRVVALFEDVQKATITRVRLSVTPSNATVLLDAVPVNGTGEFSVLIGDHVLTASRAGYKTDTLSFSAAAGSTAEAALALTRTSAVVSVVTSPANVEVLVDGVSKGRTTAGPPPGEFVAKAAASGIAARDLSGVLTVTDVAAGAHRIEFRRACYVQSERREEISQLDDYALDPVRLTPAVASLAAQSMPDAEVLIDGEPRGKTPYSSDLCEGSHTVELRTPTGRLVRRVDARAGQKFDVGGTVRPAFALVASTQTALNADLRIAVERALDALQTVMVFAPPADKLEAALKAEKLPPDWLGYDANHRPVGVSAEVTAAMRRDLSQKLAKAFDAQGIAAVTAPVAANRSLVVVTLLGAGISEPDVIELNLEQPDTIAAAMSRLDHDLTLSPLLTESLLGTRQRSTLPSPPIPAPSSCRSTSKMRRGRQGRLTSRFWCGRGCSGSATRRSSSTARLPCFGRGSRTRRTRPSRRSSV
jgi:hypothetical protein